MAIDRSFVRSAQISNTAKSAWDQFLDLYDTYTATVSAAELLLLDTAAAGTVVNSKAVIYDSAGKVFASSASPAAAGDAVGNGTALTAQFNAVTGADGTKGVVLPVAAANEFVVVVNTDASNALKVYAITGSQINALGSTVAYSVTPGQMALFVGRSATLWYTAAATDTITGLTASAAELNYNDIATLGTVQASKTVTADANLDVTGFRRITAVNTNASATPGTVRDIYGKQVTGVTLTSGNLVGTRGEVTVTNSTNVGSGVFLYGAQGKVITGTGTIDTGSGMVYGTMGQLDVTGGTITSGYVAAVGADIFGVSAGTVAVDMFYGQHADGGTINSYLRAYGKATYFFEFDTNGGSQLAVSAGSSATKYLTVRVDGVTYKIDLLANS